MEKLKKLDEKYLFNLSMLTEHMSIMNYIRRVVEYEEANNCHIDNRQFHKYNLLSGLSGDKEKDYGKIDSVK